MKIIFYTFIFLQMFYVPTVSAQEYKMMMDNPEINIYEVKQNAEEYFELHGKGKGSGWKDFQRWLFVNEPRFYPSGNRIIKADLPNISNEKTQLKSAKALSSWVELGPVQIRHSENDMVNGIGRTDPVWVDPDNEKYILCGSRTGGLWKTIDGGYNWNCLTSELNVLGVNCIAVSPTNKNEIYIGSSSGNHYWTPYGSGVLKSNDGGDTWENTAIANANDDNMYVSQITIHPSDPNIVLVATNKGLFKSTDGLATVKTIMEGSILNVLFKPTNPLIVYLSLKTNEYSIYKSINSAETFSSVDISVPKAVKNILAVSDANPEYVYVANKEGVWRSNNSGSTFNFRGKPEGSLWEGFAVSQVNPEVLFYGTSSLYISLDGGISYRKQNSKYNYPNLDQFAGYDFRFITNVNGTFYFGCDAFLGKSVDNGATYEQLHRGPIGIRENYKISSSKVDPELMLAGSQDHGTYLLNNSHWSHFQKGDGMWNGFDRDERNVMFASYQYGELRRSDDGGNSFSQASPPEKQKEGDWITPFIIDEILPNTIYAGYDKVFKSTDNGRNWNELSGTIFGGNLNNIEVAPTNSNVLFVSRGNRLWKKANNGIVWNQVSSLSSNKAITDIEISPDDDESILVSYSGYNSGEKIYRSDNGGTSWTNISANLPNIPVLCIAYDKGSHHPIYVGMDLGLYYTDDNLEGWIPFMDKLPMATVRDLEINYTNNKIRAGTWGRGLWETDRLQTSPVVEGYCSASGKEGTGIDYIEKVELNTISKSSGKSTNLYSNFLSTKTSLFRSETYNLKVKLNFHFDIDRVYAWIDWDQNKIFETSELVLSSACDANHIASVNIIVPEDAKSGETRMRIRNQYDSDAAAEPCGNEYSGEVEDYTIEILTGAPKVNFVADKRIIESGGQVTLKNLTSGNVESWLWTLSGATIETSTEKDPIVTYDNPGEYSILLTATNNQGEGNKSKIAYIKVVADLQAPEKPENLEANNESEGKMLIKWDQAYDNVETTAYNIYLGSRKIATTNNLEFLISDLPPLTTYKFFVTAIDAQGNESEKALIESTTVAAYCDTNGLIGTTGDYIDKVEFGTISNSSGKSSGLYADYTNIITEVERENTYKLTVSMNYHWNNDHIFAWIDWNNDRDFDDEGEVVINNLSPNTNHVTTVNVTVPSNAVSGTTRMRVRNQWNISNPVPCGGDIFGEIEDYGIKVKTPTSIEDLDDADQLYKVVPNPVNDILNVTCLVGGNIRINLVNMQGKNVIRINKQKLLAGETVLLDVSNLKPGLYVLMINNDLRNDQFKIIVE